MVFILFDPLIHKLTMQLKEQIVEDLEPSPGELDKDDY